MLLLNCRVCDDILRAHDDMPRSCLCGASRTETVNEELRFIGHCRVLEIEVEQYDGAAPGQDRTWRVRS